MTSVDLEFAHNLQKVLNPTMQHRHDLGCQIQNIHYGAVKTDNIRIAKNYLT